MPNRIAISFKLGICALLLLIAGCETPTNKPVRATPLEHRSESNPQTVAASEATPVVATNAPEQLPPQLNPLPPVKLAPSPTGWLDLSKWCAERGMAVPALVPGSTPKFDLRVPAGTFEIAAGNHFAQWNGMLLGLGFPARAGREGLQMNSVDIEKNILPLVLPFYFKPNEKIVVLDPGHGGVNGGTQSPQTHQIEKNLTLDWALRVKRLLAGTGWTVMLTRTNDVDLTLAQRVALADEFQPDLFVSLHFNSTIAAAKSHAESGIETYCLTPVGLPSNIVREFDDDTSKVYPNNQFDSENLQWAVRFHHQLLAATGAQDRGVRRARFMGVLREQRRPAILIEGGYLSSPHEARLLAEGAYREKLAWAVAAAIAKH